MLSVCIPIYNCNIVNLTQTIYNQCIAENINFEIVLIDDASEEHYKIENRQITSLRHVIYLELETNIGRSAIRNKFLEIVKFDYLLFLDSDSKIDDDHFISKYLEKVNDNTEIVCGGRNYDPVLKNKALKLRWKYGIKRECIAASFRSLQPYNSFLSNNFLIQRSIFECNRFDERIRNYGHEDTLFGYRLKQKGIDVAHIENSITHQFNETAGVFIEKTELAVENLYYIYSRMDVNPDFAEMVKLLKMFKRLETSNLTGLVNVLFRISSGMIKKALKKGFIWLLLLDIYKTGYLCRLAAKSTQK